MKLPSKNNSIIYVNFAPYENTGHILDFIQKKFQTVLLFSFNFHRLHQHHIHSSLTVYKNGKRKISYRLFQIPTPSALLFILLPLRSIVLFFQLFYYLSKLKDRFGPYHVYFTVNAFTAWCGNILKMFGLVEKTVFWVWDYYPPIHENKIIMFMRSLYWIFDREATHSDRLVFLNERLMNLRKDIGILIESHDYPIVGIGTNPPKIKTRILPKAPVLAFLGALKKSQGLDFIFDHGDEIHKTLPNLSIRVFGGGPDEAYFRHCARSCKIPIRFYGYIPDPVKLDHLLRSCSIGFAPYMPDPGNVSYFGDPSKIKAYMSVGLPVITTDVFQFSDEIVQRNAGILFIYGDVDNFTDAVKRMMASYRAYQNGALLLAEKYNYKIHYQQLFL